MEDVIKIASYICKRYEHQFGSRIDEIKLQILLYFTQRECMVQTGTPLFEDVFCAKTFGPYLPKVHSSYALGALTEKLSDSETLQYQSVFDKVYVPLAHKKTRSLCNLVHGEYSWNKAIGQGENTPINIEDIRKDANRFRVRCFLLNNLEELRKPAYA